MCVHLCQMFHFTDGKYACQIDNFELFKNSLLYFNYVRFKKYL